MNDQTTTRTTRVVNATLGYTNMQDLFEDLTNATPENYIDIWKLIARMPMGHKRSLGGSEDKMFWGLGTAEELARYHRRRTWKYLLDINCIAPRIYEVKGYIIEDIIKEYNETEI